MIYAPDNLIDLAEFCYNELSLGDAVVDIMYKELKVDGWCIDEEDRYTILISNTLDDNTASITLCHELVHVRQYHNNEAACELEAYGREENLNALYNLSVSRQNLPDLPTRH